MAIFDSKHQRAAWLVAILGVVIVIAMLPFASGLLAVPILYVAVAPLCERLVRAVKHRPVAAAITVAIVAIGIVLPLAWLVTLLVGQAQGAANEILKSSLLEKVGALRIGTFDVGPQLKQAGSDAVSFLAGGAFSLVGAATRVTINVLLALFGLYYLLLDPPGAWRALRPFLPFSDENVTTLGARFAAVTQATIIGSGVASIIQGVSMYFAFTVFGLENAPFWAAVVVMFSLLPVVGSGMVWAPAALVLFTRGHVGAGVGMLAWGFGVASAVDYLIRPYVSNRYAQLHPLITLIGAIAGVGYLGVVGLLIGPLALSYFFELLTMYRKEYLTR